MGSGGYSGPEKREIMSATSPPFRVLKFGGTSITGLERVEAIAEQVRERVANHAPVVVVSAFAGVTDALIRAARLAASAAPEAIR